MNSSDSKSQILAEIEKLQIKLAELERRERKSSPRVLTETQTKNIRDFERRASTGEDVAPLVEYIELEDLVGTEVFESVLKNEQRRETHCFEVRGQSIQYYTPNLRSLWQSAGQEYIEPELLDFIDGIPIDGVFFDVGASTGVFAMYAALKGKMTVCFEPEVANFEILNTNSFLNHKKIKNNFLAFNVALSNEKSISEMYIRKFEGAAHEKVLGKSEGRVGTSSFTADYIQSVITVSMDEFCDFSSIVPTDIKVDVDGAELAVIEGMRNSLSNPTLKRIFIEISENDESSILALNSILASGFVVHKRTRVQNYFTEYNYILHRV